jgi:hypothetical protein
MQTVRGPQADGLLFLTQQGAARWTGRTVRWMPADSPRGPGGRFARSRRTVRPAQRSVPPAVDFEFFPLEFKRGQSAWTSRTVREVRVLLLTTSNGKADSPRGTRFEPTGRLENGTGKSRPDRHRIPSKPSVNCFVRKTRKLGKNWENRRETVRNRLRCFPDRFSGYCIRPGKSCRSFPYFWAS